MKRKLTVEEARDRLPEILKEAATGRHIEITKGDGTTYTVTVHVRPLMDKPVRTPNLHPGSFSMRDDFNDELSDSFWLGQ